MKKIKTLMLIIGCVASVFTQAKTGLALIHGTGSQTDAYHDYWTGDFVNSVKQGLSDQSLIFVVNCDFNQFMWDNKAAGCLAGQLTDFVNQHQLTDLKLVTHSNGGNIVRWVLSNPTFDPRYPALINTISRVIALAPSSAGTPLADAALNGNVFESSLGWLLGYQSDAVRQQQEGWMAYYNANQLYGTPSRPSLPTVFENVVGSDVESAFWDGDSYCGGYQYQVALEVTQNWLDSCSDGFLNCTSQQAAGTTWFKDIEKTRGREPLSHHQSRRDCFNLDKLIRDRI